MRCRAQKVAVWHRWGGDEDDSAGTPRLRVTTWLDRDLDDLHRLHGDPEVMRFLRGGLPETRAEAAERLALYLREQVDPGWTKWRVETNDGVMVGRGGFGGHGSRARARLHPRRQCLGAGVGH